MSMSTLTIVILAASIMEQMEVQCAAQRIQQAQYCAAVDRRAQHREIERQPAAQDLKPARGLTDLERAQLREALELLARCSTGKLVRDQVSGFYVPEQKEGCR